MHHRKTLAILITIGVIIGIILITKPHVPIKEPLKIGATLALSGNLAFIGESEKNGLVMAVDEINTSNGINGRKLELIIEDNQGEGKIAVNTVNKLLSIDNVDILFSAFTHITNNVKDIAARNNKTMIYAATVNDIAQSNSYFFKDYLDVQQGGEAIGRVVANLGHKKIKFLVEVHEACQQYEEAIRNKTKQFGIEITQKETFQSSEKDFKSQLNKLKETPFDALIFCGFRHEPIFMKQLKELGMIDIPSYHFTASFLPAADTSEMRSLFSENRTVSTWYGFSPNTSETKQKAFIERYKARFGSEPRPDSAYAYDDVYAIAEALKACDKKNDVSSPCIAQEFQKTNIDGAGGLLRFDEDRSSIRPVVLIRAENNEWNEIPLPE